MVRKGKFEVTVVRPSDGTPFHEVLDPASGAVYVVAEPGANYEIEVSRRDASPNKTYRFIPKVDGRSLGVCKVLTALHPSERFEGFVKQGSCHGITYHLFQFAAAQADTGREATSTTFEEGRILMSVTEVRDSGREAPDFSGAAEGAVGKVAAMPEGKKFFLAPSLTTGVGGVKASASGFSRRQWDAVGPELESFEIRYETATTLLLRTILRRDNPAHAAILDSFAATRAQPAANDDDDDDDDGADAGAAGPSSRRVKREPIETVDLTAERLAQGEELVCDMTADGDGEAPRWAKRRRE